MFRMEFHSLDAEEEDEDHARSYGNKVTRGAGDHEQYKRRASAHSPPKFCQGQVGKLGKSIASASSLNPEGSISKNWVEVDLIDFSGSPKATTQVSASTGEQAAIRELVKPFAQLVNLTNGATGNTILENQPLVPDLLSNGVEASVSPGISAGVSPSTSTLRVRTDSMGSSHSSPRSEDSDTTAERLYVKDEEKGSPASHTLNKAFNNLMHHKKNKLTVPESKVDKAWDEPLLLIHEQAKSQQKAQKEAKLEAQRRAEEAKRVAEIQQRELLELANPVPESSMKHQKDNGMRKGIHKLFYVHGGIHSNSSSPREGVHGDIRESKLAMPKAGLFEAPRLFPSSTEITLAQMRSGPRPVIKPEITFATVESNQRDVRPWTMEEYMTKNGRLGEWEKRERDEEFGGIEGKQLLNQYFNNHDDALDNLDSDND